jgi:hypothetical protein
MAIEWERNKEGVQEDSLCEEARISSTTGTVEFNQNSGRKVPTPDRNPECLPLSDDDDQTLAPLRSPSR